MSIGCYDGQGGPTTGRPSVLHARIERSGSIVAYGRTVFVGNFEPLTGSRLWGSEDAGVDGTGALGVAADLELDQGVIAQGGP